MNGMFLMNRGKVNGNEDEDETMWGGGALVPHFEALRVHAYSGQLIC